MNHIPTKSTPVSVRFYPHTAKLLKKMAVLSRQSQADYLADLVEKDALRRGHIRG